MSIEMSSSFPWPSADPVLYDAPWGDDASPRHKGSVPMADGGVLSVPAGGLTVAAAVILTAALAAWLAAPPEARDAIVRGAVDKTIKAAAAVHARVLLPSRDELISRVSGLFSSIERAGTSVTQAGNVIENWVGRLTSRRDHAPSTPALQTPPSVPSTPSVAATPTKPTVPARPTVPATPAESIDPAGGRAQQMFSSALANARTANHDVNRLRGQSDTAGRELQGNAAQFYWHATGGSAGLPRLHATLQKMDQHLAALRRIYADANAPVSALKAAYARLTGAVTSNGSYGLAPEATDAWENVGRWASDADSWRYKINNTVNAFSKWVSESWQYVSDATHRPSQARLPVPPPGAGDAVNKAWEQAITQPLKVPPNATPITHVSSGDDASEGGAGAVPPGAAAAPGGAPEPPPNNRDLARRVVTGALASATLKGAAYIIKHRSEKTPQQMLTEPGLWIAVTQGGIQGALMGAAVNAQLGTKDMSQVMLAIRNDFVYSGLAGATIDALLSAASKGVDLSSPQAVLSSVADYFGTFLDVGTDWAALGLVPSSLFKVPPATVTDGYFSSVISNHNGAITRLPKTSEVSAEFWKNFVGQTGIRSLLGIGNDFGNQLATANGQADQVNSLRLMLSGLGSAMYPAAMQLLQRAGVHLSKVPGFGEYAQVIATNVQKTAWGSKLVTRTIQGTASDTNTPVFAYGGRAILYGLSISVLKREMSAGADLPSALERLNRLVEKAKSRPDETKKLLESPQLLDTLREMDRLSFLDKATLLGGYVPSPKAASELSVMRSDTARFNDLLAQQRQPDLPASSDEWNDPARVQRFHDEIDAMIHAAYRQWNVR